jgi:hypothetical protein
MSSNDKQSNTHIWYMLILQVVKRYLDHSELIIFAQQVVLQLVKKLVFLLLIKEDDYPFLASPVIHVNTLEELIDNWTVALFLIP